MVSTLLAVVCAYVLPQTQAALHFTFAKHLHIDGVKTAIASNTNRRTVNTDVSYADVTYVVNATIGTPGQAVSLVLSTSSSDTWVVDARSSWCSYSSGYSYDDGDDEAYDVRTADSSVKSEYCTWGTFTPANSTSFELLSASENEDSYYYDYDFSISYDDGSYAYGSYMSDVLMLGGVPVSNLTMGLVNSTSTYHGVLGIGYNDSVYDNLPDRLRDQGVINSTAYSLWVDDEQASSGNLLFGAIDTAKFEGNLTRIISEYTTQMSVEIYGIDSSIPGGGNGSVAIVFPNETDSSDGSYYTGVYGYPFSATFSPPDSVSHLPTEIASQIWRMAGAYYDAEIELAVISCSTQNDTSLGNLTISLSPSADGPVITAPRVDLIIPAQDINISSYYSYYFDGDEGLCLFGVQNASLTGGFEYNLGSTLLRRTYSVFDLVNMEIAVAPVKFGATATSNIVNFSTYGAVVPSASMYCSSYTCSDDSSTNSGGDDDGNDTAALLGVLSLGALLGLSFGLGLGLLALGTAGFLIWRRRRKNALVAKDAGSVSSGEVDNTSPAPAAMSGAATAWRGITESARGAPGPQDANGASLPVAPAGEHFHAEGSTNAGLASEAHDAQAGSSSSSDVDRNA